jgi:hypothetical protein
LEKLADAWGEVPPDLPEGESYTCVCPKCGNGKSGDRNRSFGVYVDMPNCILWNCFRAKCGFKGGVNLLGGRLADIPASDEDIDRLLPSRQPGQQQAPAAAWQQQAGGTTWDKRLQEVRWSEAARQNLTGHEADADCSRHSTRYGLARGFHSLQHNRSPAASTPTPSILIVKYDAALKRQATKYATRRLPQLSVCPTAAMYVQESYSPPQPIDISCLEPWPLPPSVADWFASRGIDTDTLQRAGVTWARRWSYDEERVVDVAAFPSNREGVVVNVKFREVDHKRFMQLAGGERVFYGYDEAKVG